jgi:hypothetical protein
MEVISMRPRPRGLAVAAALLLSVAWGAVATAQEPEVAAPPATAEGEPFVCALPRWSPDGKRIAFLRDAGRWDRQEVWTVNAEGTGLARVAAQLVQATDPSWAPDGQTIAISGRATRDGERQIWIADPRDAAKARQLTRTPGAKCFPCFAPDGQRIIYVSASGVGIVRLDGSDERLLVQVPPPDDQNAALYLLGPRFSPDGRWIAFGPLGQWPRSRVWVAKSDGGDRVEVAGSEGAFNTLTWTPDGTLALLCGGGATEEVRLCADIGAAHPRAEAIRGLPLARGFDWSPDGKSLVVARHGGLLFVDAETWDERPVPGIPTGPPAPSPQEAEVRRLLAQAEQAELVGQRDEARTIYRAIVAAGEHVYAQTRNVANRKLDLALALAIARAGLEDAAGSDRYLAEYRRLLATDYPGFQAEAVRQVAAWLPKAQPGTRILLLLAAGHAGMSYVAPDAVPLLEELLAMDPDCAPTHFMLASACREAGDAATAEEHERRYEELSEQTRGPAEVVPEVAPDAEMLLRECEGKLRALGQGFSVYRGDWHKWPDKLADLGPYVGGGDEAFRCPEDTRPRDEGGYEYARPRAEPDAPGIVVRCPLHGDVTLVLMSDGMVVRRSTAELDAAEGK